jgi:type IV pilus assembly protein PilM
LIIVFFGSKKIVGLDIGASSIKMAELELSRAGAKVLSFAVSPSPPNAFVNGDIQDSESLSNTIRQMVLEHKIKRKHVSTGMAGTAVIVKKITIPRIDKKLLADQVRWEAEQYIPFDVNSISLAHHVIETGNPEMMDILLVAAQNEVVGNYTQAINGAGLNLAVLDVSGFALANIFEFSYGKLPGQTVALLNLGATTTSFVVVHDGNVVFNRDMNIGGQNYTTEIHKELAVSMPEAEALKLSAVRGEGVPDEVHSIVSSGNESLKEEVRNSFDYFAGTATNMGITQCFFTGGASGTPGLMESISQAVGIPMEPLNPFMRMSGSKNLTPTYFEQVSPFAAIALGLALRKAGD